MAKKLQVSVDDVRFRDLYRKSEYEVATSDGWHLVITRFEPVKQKFEQPLFGVPMLCCHGFSQNRHAWTAGDFVKNMLYFGVDIHLLELRGHGKSSRKFQFVHAERNGHAVPADIDFEWDIDSYFLHDLPAAIDAVRAKTGHAKIFYCGHSMGGMIGYGHASLQRGDLAGMVTIGSPAVLGAEFFPLRLAAMLSPLVLPAGDVAMRALDIPKYLKYAKDRVTNKDEAIAPRGVGWKMMPMDWFFDYLGKGFNALPGNEELLQRFPVLADWLWSPAYADFEDVQWILRWGAEKEPMGVIHQFARWVRYAEMKCYRSGYDFHKNLYKIDIPMAIIFGDRDKLCGVRSTKKAYYNASSEYLLWRPVRGNSHLELTMGNDIRQICYDIKNLMDYSLSHPEGAKSLPRKRRAKAS